MEENKVKGLAKLKKADLIDIILRKDDVDKSKNSRIDELNTKLSASEKLICELKEGIKAKNTAEQNAKEWHANYKSISKNLDTLRRSKSDLTNELASLNIKASKLNAENEELNDRIHALVNANKYYKTFGWIGVILCIVAILLVVL